MGTETSEPTNCRKRSAKDTTASSFTVTLDFSTTGSSTVPPNSASGGKKPQGTDDDTVIHGISPELLIENAELFRQFNEDLVVGPADVNSEVLVIPMPQGDVKTMEHILAFFGSECSSEHVKERVAAPNLLHLRESLSSQLFHPSVLRWLRRFDDCDDLLKVLALAHYIGAPFLKETVALYLAREILLVVHDEGARLLSTTSDPFSVLPLHAKMVITKHLSCLLSTPRHFDIHFPSMVDALALNEDIWERGWPLGQAVSNVQCWGSDINFARMLRQRCRLQEEDLQTASVVASIRSISSAGCSWEWLKEALRTFGRVHLREDEDHPREEDWRELGTLLAQNKNLSTVSLVLGDHNVPPRFIKMLASKRIVQLNLSVGNCSSVVVELLPELVFLEHLCCVVGCGENEEDDSDGESSEHSDEDEEKGDEVSIPSILKALPNLKSLNIRSGKDLCSKPALKAFAAYDPTTHEEPIVCTCHTFHSNEEKLKKQYTALRDLMETNPRVSFRVQKSSHRVGSEIHVFTFEDI